MSETQQPQAPEATPEVAPEVAPARARARTLAPEPAPEAAPAPAEAGDGKSRKPRPVLATVARWTAAVVVCGGLATGTAAAITSMERTDVPGLATESDGRWDYPKLTLPQLPAGSPRPFTSDNFGEIHHADLRALLLPAPAGARVDPKRDGDWVSVDDYVALYEKSKRDDLRQAIEDSALRHVAVRSWTMPDGTKSAVYLLRFKSVGFSESFKDNVLDAGSDRTVPLVGAASVERYSISAHIRVPGTALYALAEEEPYGAEQVRWAYIQAGDTLGLVVQSQKGGAATVPFRQTVALQNQLLG
ncbi:hypothetical protein AB0C52_04465 [Streptomyces sp. NPDC048717]|uniref:hypothetical protein n=1 Tax=Streptomyces sp. NPDC048717 TaxID=3154928 RepID=UPI0034365106